MDEDEGQRRSLGWAKLVVAGLIAIIAVCAIGYVVGSRAVPHNNLYSVDHNVAIDLGADNGAIPTYSGPSPAEQATNQMAPAADLPVAPPPSAAPDPMAGSVAEDMPAAPPAESGPPASDADQQGRQEIGDAIEAATQDALDRGGSVRWHKDGLSGFAIAGAALTADGRTCRNAYATTVRDTGESRTPTVRWCRTGDDGAWAAQ